MAAPAALGISKLFYPETERSLTTMDNIELPKVGNGRVRVMTRVTSRADGKSQVRQWLGFGHELGNRLFLGEVKR